MIIENFPIAIDIETILSLSGYSEKRPAPRRFVEAAQEMIDRGRQLSHPRAVFEVYEKVESDDGAVILGGGRFTGKILSRVLSGSDCAAVYALTLGPELDEESGRLSRGGDVLLSVLLDTIGTLALARASLLLVKTIYDAQAVPRGCAVTSPFGPGQCKWDLAEQRVIFDRIDPGKIGIVLTDTCLMIPKKSVSGIMGIGKAEEIFVGTPCSLCDKKDCPGRKMFDVVGVSL